MAVGVTVQGLSVFCWSADCPQAEGFPAWVCIRGLWELEANGRRVSLSAFQFLGSPFVADRVEPWRRFRVGAYVFPVSLLATCEAGAWRCGG